jgi:hypothetical protein
MRQSLPANVESAETGSVCWSFTACNTRCGGLDRPEASVITRITLAQPCRREPVVTDFGPIELWSRHGDKSKIYMHFNTARTHIYWDMELRDIASIFEGGNGSRSCNNSIISNFVASIAYYNITGAVLNIL